MSVEKKSVNTLLAISAAVDTLTAIATLTARLQTVNALLQKAHAEGRELSDAELNSVVGLDDAARDRLQKLIG